LQHGWAGLCRQRADTVAPFLLSVSPGEVAQTLNRIAHLDEIDVALFNAAKRLRDKNAELKVAEQQKASLEEQHQQFDYLDQMERDVRDAELLEQSVEDLSALSVQIDGIVREWNELQSLLSDLPDMSGAERLVVEVTGLSQQVFELTEKEHTLSAVLRDLKATQADLIGLPDADGLGMLYDVWILDSKALAAGWDRLSRLDGLLDEYRSEQAKVGQMEREVQELEVEYHENMPDECPLCGQVIEGDH
jgi:DNA repair ATPase RecN